MPPRQTSGETNGPARPGNILQLQRTVGNVATQRLLAQRMQAAETPSVAVREKTGDAAIQRGFFGDIWSDVKEWWQKGLDKAELKSKVRSALGAESVNVDKLVKLIKRTQHEIRRSLYDDDDMRRTVVSKLSGEDLVRVLSAILAGKSYSPGWQADLYNSWPDYKREYVDEMADRYFKNDTGVERPLDPKSSTDKPLVRQWLRLRDLAVENAIKREEYLEEKKEKSEKRYEFYLKEAIEKMKDVGFSSLLDMSGKPDYGLKYWDLVEDKEFVEETGRENQGMLVYNGRAPYPALAVEELYEPKNLKRWAMDCAEFVQAASLYARLRSLGDHEFNKLVEAEGGTLKFRMHYSTGYRQGLMYQRDSGDVPMELTLPNGKKLGVAEDIDFLLEQAPVGSRIVWRNSKGAGTDFFNENTVKVGDNQYAAHGFKQKVFTRGELEMALAKKSYGRAAGEPTAEYIAANVFVRTIEHVQIPMPSR
jgi:hypothetical protein